MKDQLVHRTAEESFQIVTYLATDVIFAATYINENIVKKIFQNSTLNLSGSGFVAIEESVGYAEYLEGNVKSKHGHPEEDLNKFSCTAADQRIKLSTAEMYLRVVGRA